MAALKGGARLERVLKDIGDRVKRGNAVRVGFLEGSTAANGTSLPMIAAVNEYGGAINVPEHTTTIYRQLKKNGDLAKGGRFVRAERSNFATDHVVPAHTVNIPMRPYFRTMIAKQSPGWGVRLGKILVGAKYDGALALGRMGEVIKGQLQDSIREWTDPPNAPSTVAKKGFDKPLIETGHMLNSVDYEVSGGGSGGN